MNNAGAAAIILDARIRATNTVFPGLFAHDCREEDIEDAIGGQRCRVCDPFVSNPEQ